MYRQLKDAQLQELVVVVVVMVVEQLVEEIIFFSILQMIHLDYKLDQRLY